MGGREGEGEEIRPVKKNKAVTVKSEDFEIREETTRRVRRKESKVFLVGRGNHFLVTIRIIGRLVPTYGGGFEGYAGGTVAGAVVDPQEERERGWRVGVRA
ncbi:hypothetical protein RUM44_004368 [Polyplax serrata]|uniref:Uncharacterized protein n=1 Tax=Polyplax serrata TaxID=468196 RepID=A0ABR1B2M5_POLSC